MRTLFFALKAFLRSCQKKKHPLFFTQILNRNIIELSFFIIYVIQYLKSYRFYPETIAIIFGTGYVFIQCLPITPQPPQQHSQQIITIDNSVIIPPPLIFTNMHLKISQHIPDRRFSDKISINKQVMSGIEPEPAANLFI